MIEQIYLITQLIFSLSIIGILAAAFGSDETFEDGIDFLGIYLFSYLALGLPVHWIFGRIDIDGVWHLNDIEDVFYSPLLQLVFLSLWAVGLAIYGIAAIRRKKREE